MTPVPDDASSASQEGREEESRARDDDLGVLLVVVLQPLSDCRTTWAVCIVDLQALMVNCAPRCGCSARGRRPPLDAPELGTEDPMPPNRWLRRTGRPPSGSDRVATGLPLWGCCDSITVHSPLSSRPDHAVRSCCQARKACGRRAASFPRVSPVLVHDVLRPGGLRKARRPDHRRSPCCPDGSRSAPISRSALPRGCRRLVGMMACA